MINTVNNWSSAPFIRILIPFLTGIIICYSLEIPASISPWIFIPGITVLIIIRKYYLTLNSFQWRWLFGIVANLLIMTLGFYLTEVTYQLDDKEHFSNQVYSPEMVYIATVTSQPVEKANTFKATVRVSGIKDISISSRIEESCGNIMISFKKDTLNKIPKYGDRILFSKAPRLTEKPGNPGEFNYQAYLKLKRIYHTLYIKQDEYSIQSEGHGNYIIATACRAREQLLNTFKRAGFNSKEYHVAAAILTGYDDTLPSDQRKVFADAVVIHILCVSGLHVGVIYLLANFLLSFLPNRRSSFVIKFLTIVAIVWLYALITGLAPPVTRAAFMFSMLLLGNTLQRTTNKYNVLSASAFILLVNDPLLLFDIGFQLSYAAVTGIMIFNERLKGLWSTKNFLLNKIWELITVSLSAQILVTPLIIYYFHRFPNYFILANLVAVPLSGWIIYSGIVFFFVSSIPYLSDFIAMLLQAQIKLLINFTNWISNLPGSNIENIHASFFTSIILLVAIFSMVHYIISIRKAYLWAFLVALLILITSFYIREGELKRQKMIVFHKTGYHPLISFIDSRNHTILTDKELYNDIEKAKYQLEGLTIKAGLNKTKCKCMSTFKNKDIRHLPDFYIFAGNEIVIVSGNCFLPDKLINEKANFVLLCNNPPVPISKVRECFPKAYLILDNSCFGSNKDNLIKQANFSGIELYNLNKEGALVVRCDENLSSNKL